MKLIGIIGISIAQLEVIRDYRKMKIIFLLISLLLIGCSSADEPQPGYIETFTIPDAYEICNEGECGPYPEFMKCGDGSFPKELKCVFVSDFGCKWIIFECFEG